MNPSVIKSFADAPEMTAAFAQASQDALAEAIGAATKFPGLLNGGDNRFQWAATGEEFGELAKALMEHSRDGSATPQEIYTEAMQLAAMAIRIAVEGSSEFTYKYDAELSKNFRPTGAPKPKPVEEPVEVRNHIHVNIKPGADPNGLLSERDRKWLADLVEAGVAPKAGRRKPFSGIWPHDGELRRMYGARRFRGHPEDYVRTGPKLAPVLSVVSDAPTWDTSLKGASAPQHTG